MATLLGTPSPSHSSSFFITAYIFFQASSSSWSATASEEYFNWPRTSTTQPTCSSPPLLPAAFLYYHTVNNRALFGVPSRAWTLSGPGTTLLFPSWQNIDGRILTVSRSHPLPRSRDSLTGFFQVLLRCQRQGRDRVKKNQINPQENANFQSFYFSFFYLCNLI